jgi:charged multivesicular body protein 6
MGNQPSSHKITDVDRAILNLKNQRNKILDYQKKIRVVTDLETQAAKDLLRQGDKKRALIALRRKKYQESLLTKTDDQLFQLEKLVNTVEFSLVQKDVIFGLQHGANVLKELNKEMRIEDVERLLDTSADAIAYQKEVGDLVGSRISNAEADEVDEELEALEAQVRIANGTVTKNKLTKYRSRRQVFRKYQPTRSRYQMYGSQMSSIPSRPSNSQRKKNLHPQDNFFQLELLQYQ